MEKDSPAVELPPSPESVSAARRFVRQQCQQWQIPDGCDRIMLLVSETVTNAVKHAHSRLVEVRLVRRPPALRVEVRDEDSSRPVAADQSPEAESGRGMHLVEELSDEWGVTEHAEGGKTVWFQVTPEDQQPAAPRE